MMPDVNPWAIFWTAFFTALPVVLTQVLSHIRQMHGIIENRNETKGVGEAAKVIGDKAQQAVQVSETTGKEIIAKAKTIEQTANKIDERLNGGDNGLGSRVAKNEARLESLEKGQKTHDEAIGAVARSVDRLTMGFADFTAKFGQSNPSPEEIRGESGRRE